MNEKRRITLTAMTCKQHELFISQYILNLMETLEQWNMGFCMQIVYITKGEKLITNY